MELPPLPQTPKKREITLDGETTLVISDSKEDDRPRWQPLSSPTDGGRRSKIDSIRHLVRNYRKFQATQETQGTQEMMELDSDRHPESDEEDSQPPTKRARVLKYGEGG